MIRIGIDLGGTNIAVGAVNERHEIIARCSVPTGAERPAQAVIADMCAAVEEALRRAGAEYDTETRERVTKADLVSLGLSGGVDSAAKRRVLQKKLALPENLSANALLDAVNSLYTREEFLSAAQAFENEGCGVTEEEKAAGGGLELGGEPVESVGARRERADM